jgi:hypothetical protein
LEAKNFNAQPECEPNHTTIAKNRAQLFTLFALGNLFLVRRKLMA